MAVYMDDEVVELSGTDLEAVLGAARTHLEPGDRVVVEVEVDGRSLSAEELDQAEQTSVGESSDVRLYTAERRELAMETLGHVRTRLTEAQRIQEEAAQLLQQDEQTRAMRKLGGAVEVWLQTQQAVGQSAVLLGMELDQVEVDGRPMPELTQELIDKLTELKQLIGDDDSVALADTLAHEWPDLVRRWDRLVATLMERIQAS